MKKLHFLLSTFLVFIFTSCGEDELKGVVLSEDPGYVKEPLVAIQAEDGTGNWINGLIDQNSRVIALDFRILDDQSAVNVKLKLADEWAKPIDPLTTDAVLDLSSGITRIKVNDGADDIEYTIFSTSTQLLRGVTATCNTEQVSANFINGIASLRFKQNTAFANVVLMPTLADNAEIISTDPSSQKDENGNLIVDLNSTLTITVKDNTNNMTKKYQLSAVNGIIDAGVNWKNITADLKSQHSSICIPDFMIVYENKNLHGRSGNTGWLITIPAGKINMKVSWDMNKDNVTWAEPTAQHRTTAIMNNNMDYSLFVPGLSGQFWVPIFYSLGWNDSGLLSAPRLGYNLSTSLKYCPGTLGIMADGKAEISYAEVIDNNLYKFTSGGAGKQAANGVQWSPTSAVSGYSYPLQKGQIMIAGENAELYKTFATNEGRNTSTRNRGMDGALSGSNSWAANPVSIWTFDGKPVGRRAVGITEEGDLVIFVSNRFTNSYNSVKAAWNVFSDGSSLREVAVALQEVGCTDAIVFGENYHSPVVIRDDSRGVPLGKVAGRYDWETNGNVKNADNEASSQSWIMFK